MTWTRHRAIGSVISLLLASTLVACSGEGQLMTPSAAVGEPTPRSTPPAASPGAEPVVVPEGCPQPNEPIRAAEFQRYGNSRCFPAGVSITGWWEVAADGGVTFGPRPGSVGVMLHGADAIRVNLRDGGASLPEPIGFGLLFAPTVRDGTELGMVLLNARITALDNPATTCPTTSPIPVAVFLESLTTCFKPDVDVAVAGIRDQLDGLGGEGPVGYVERPGWLTSPYGFGWLFVDPVENLDDYVTLYAPDERALGADSGKRPTAMEVTGHFGDPAASTCRAVPDPEADPSVRMSTDGAKKLTQVLVEICANRFVVTSIRDTAAPT